MKGGTSHSFLRKSTLQFWMVFGLLSKYLATIFEAGITSIWNSSRRMCINNIAREYSLSLVSDDTHSLTNSLYIANGSLANASSTSKSESHSLLVAENLAETMVIGF